MKPAMGKRRRFAWVAGIVAVLLQGSNVDGFGPGTNSTPIEARCSSVHGILTDANATPPALFTSAQANSGRIRFLAHCAACHGATLEGRSAPALKGSAFAAPRANLAIGEVFAIVANDMPATAPGMLTHEDYVDIMAFVLRQNGYPAGDRALTFEEATKSEVKLLYLGRPTDDR